MIRVTYVGSAKCAACPQVYKMLKARNIRFDVELDLSKATDQDIAAKLGVRPSLPQVVIETGNGNIYLGPDVRAICQGLRDVGRAA